MTRRRFIKAALCSGALAQWQARDAFAAKRSPGDGHATPDGRVLVRDAAIAFGTTVTLSALHADVEHARLALRAALDAVLLVDHLMSLYRADSEVSRLNRDGTLAQAHEHTRAVLAYAQSLSARTQGAFDITVQPLWEIYAEAKKSESLPAATALQKARARVNWKALVLASAPAARLTRPDMRITLNGVAQGYAADMALQILRARGITDALIDTGEFGAEGRNASQQPWTVGIAHPRAPDSLIASVQMDGRFVATSGDYATSFTPDFLYHHIFEPNSGVSPRQWASVVVAARTGLEADGLSTALMVLGETRGRALLAQSPGSDAMWIDKQMRVTQTGGMRATLA
jgi:thiamine biosynthesis lipoprotein